MPLGSLIATASRRARPSGPRQLLFQFVEGIADNRQLETSQFHFGLFPCRIREVAQRRPGLNVERLTPCFNVFE